MTDGIQYIWLVVLSLWNVATIAFVVWVKMTGRNGQ